jgi:hypothetical protein
MACAIVVESGRLLLLESFGHFPLDLLQARSALALQGGFAVGVFLASHPCVRQSQLIVPGRTVRGEFLVGFQRRNGFFETLRRDQCRAEAEIGFREASVEFGSAGEMANR